jgi:FixJ family two-component response regulator
MSTTVHLIDDDTSLRNALGRLLALSGYEVCSYDCAEQFLAAPAQPGGCILLDIDMPGMSGLQLQEQLVARGSVLPIVFLTGQGSIAASVRTIKAGAEDFLCKPVDQAQLLPAIERALARFVRESGERSAEQELAARVALLSPREREVFNLVITGLLNKQIADRLGTSERTIKAHRAAITDKLKVRSVAEMVSIASQLRIL